MKKIKFPLTVIKIFMKNQMQNRTYILLDIFNMVSRCLIVFLLYGYVFRISGGSINGVDYTTTLWSMFIYFCIMILNIRRIHKLIMDDVKSVVRHEISLCEERGIRDWATIKSSVKENLRDYLFIKTKRNPMIIPIKMEV